MRCRLDSTFEYNGTNINRASVCLMLNNHSVQFSINYHAIVINYLLTKPCVYKDNKQVY